MEELHDIVSAKPLEGYKVAVVFDTGVNDIAFFNRVRVDYGTLVWTEDVDIGPEDVWEFTEREQVDL